MTDREIDVLVAEKVMGWKPNATHPYLRGCGWWEESLDEFSCEIPEFTSSPSWWEQVLDKMVADGWSWQITAGDGVFLCLFWQGEETDLCASEEAATKGRAICLAVLMACDVEVKEAAWSIAITRLKDEKEAK